MFLKPFYRYETGCAAYVLGCGTCAKCAVVDPQEQDVTAYADLARSKGMQITHVIDTHVHADHRSGGRALAALASARYCLHRSAEVSWLRAAQDRPGPHARPPPSVGSGVARKGTAFSQDEDNLWWH